MTASITVPDICCPNWNEATKFFIRNLEDVRPS